MLNNCKICAIGLLLAMFVSSCATYEHGFIKHPERLSSQAINADKQLIVLKKKELNQQAEQLVAEMEQRQQQKLPATPLQLNLLFENLNENYRTDSLLHLQYQKAIDNEEKAFWYNQLAESAANYNLLFQQNENIRRIVNHGDLSFGVKKNVLKHSQQFVAHNEPYLKQIALPVDSKKIKKQRTADFSFNLLHNTVGGISMLVGVLISNIHLAPQPKKNIPRLMPHLEPYDIILQKSRNRLTDKFIPGYFGHAAIYMGDSLFAEALHEGVVLNGPFRFAEGDSYLVVRAKNLTPAQKERVKKLVEIQFGKKYDYQYDAELTHEITCSELVYMCFDFIPWNTHKLMGRHTFSPDDVPVTVINNDELEFVVYFDKKQTVLKPSNEFINKLLQK